MKRFIGLASLSLVTLALSWQFSNVSNAAPRKAVKKATYKKKAPAKKAPARAARKTPKKASPARAAQLSGQSRGGSLPDLGVNASLRGKQVLPVDNVWNTPVDQLPLDPNSARYVASIGENAPFHPDWGNNPKWGIPYVVVSGTQPRVPVQFNYADESDQAPYPIPPNPPIEGGNESDGDRHILMVDRDNWKLYELFSVRLKNGQWTAGSGAIFDLNSNALRPAGWTSADAAGLPIFPGLVRADEVFEQKEIRHALRFTCRATRRAYVFPARHWASRSSDPNLPPMGMRVRLKADYDISRFAPNMQVILRALKKYGMILADNGSDWFVSGSHDPRWNDDELNSLKRLKGRDFEVVQMGNVTSG